MTDTVVGIAPPTPIGRPRADTLPAHSSAPPWVADVVAVAQVVAPLFQRAAPEVARVAAGKSDRWLAGAALVIAILALLSGPVWLGVHEERSNRHASKRIENLEDAQSLSLELHQDREEWSEALLVAIAAKLGVPASTPPDRRAKLREIRRLLNEEDQTP